MAPLKTPALAPPTPEGAGLDPCEVNTLAGIMAAEYTRLVKWYRDNEGLSPEDATAKAQPSRSTARQIMDAPADQVSWCALSELAALDPALAQERWQALKATAIEELQSGHRAAAPLDPGNSKPITRARFLALRGEMAREWCPRGTMEMTLIEQLAHAYTQYLEWMERHTHAGAYNWLETDHENGTLKKTPVTRIDYVDYTAAMIDRWNRMYLRTLRALRDLRRYPVTVTGAAQVNIGAQQVNISGEESDT